MIEAIMKEFDKLNGDAMKAAQFLECTNAAAHSKMREKLGVAVTPSLVWRYGGWHNGGRRRNTFY